MRAFAALGLCLLAGACQQNGKPAAAQPEVPAGELFRFSGQAFGTSYMVRGLPGPGAPADLAEQLERAFEARLQAFDKVFNTYRPDSEISRFNAWRSTEVFACSAALRDLTREALAVAGHSQGAFDPTLAPLLRLYGMGPGAPEVSSPPDESVRRAVLAKVGWGKLTVTDAGLQKAHPELELDLNAIAKGAGVDAAAAVLRPRLRAALVEIGGEVYCFGRKPGGKPWVLGIEDPQRASREPGAIVERVELRDEAMATSGTYRQFKVLEGQRYPHILDGRIQERPRAKVVSVTVVAPSCAQADAWATALQVLGPEAGEQALAAAGLQLRVFYQLATDGGLAVLRKRW